MRQLWLIATVMQPASGTTANQSGALLERMVETAVRGWITDRVMPWGAWMEAGKPAATLVRHLPYLSIYGSDRSRSEFGLVAANGEVIRIECKWQSSGGSVDEKFPYVVENMLIVPEDRIIILATGGGAKPHALRWLADEAPKRGRAAGKDIRVMTDLSEFMSWAQTNRALGHDTLTEL